MMNNVQTEDWSVIYNRIYAEIYTKTIAVKPVLLDLPDGNTMITKSFYRNIGNNVLDINTQIYVNNEFVGYSIHNSGTLADLRSTIPFEVGVSDITQRIEDNYCYETQVNIKNNKRLMICKELHFSEKLIRSSLMKHVFENCFEMLKKANFSFDTGIYCNVRLSMQVNDWNDELENVHSRLLNSSNRIKYVRGESFYFAK